MFDDVELPDDFQYGSLYGMGFGTIVQEGRSGHEKRVQTSSQSRHQFRLLRKIQSQVEAFAFKVFALARRGSFAAFKLKDALDYTSSPVDGAFAPTYFDQALGTGDGTKKDFYLFKTYDPSGARPYPRRISLPVTGSVIIAINGTPTTSFTVSANGLVTFAAAPTAGALITCGFEFRVPVRFQQTVEKWVTFNAEYYQTWSLVELDCVEVIDETEWPDRFNPGGGRVWGVVSADIRLNFADGVLQAVKPSANINAILPNATVAPSGWNLFTIWNDPTSSGNIQVKDDLGANVGSALTPGQIKTFGFVRSATTITWVQT